MTQILHLAKIIITNSGEPIFNGGLLIEDSRIIKVGKKEDFGDLADVKIVNHGESLICPGFINLHAHLLYTNRINGEEGLFPWLEELVDETSAFTEKDFTSSIKHGIDQAISTGTTFIVENTPNTLSTKEIARSPLKALIGIEVFGSDEEKADEIFDKTLRRIADSSIRPIDLTLSPHAPYDVSKPLWKRLLQWSQENNKPLLTHLEESPQEKLWWNEKSGQGVNFWKKINKLEPKLKYWKKYGSGIDFLNKNDLLSKNIIGTHLCQAKKEDLITLKENSLKLVHCPRSNFYLNNGTANIKLWDELGFLWGIGTDSIASNNNLDLLEEIRFAINQQNLIYDYQISARNAFEKITQDAAKIISKDTEIGSLKEGYSADFLIYNVKEKSGCTYQDPYHLLIWDLDNNKDLKEVWISGKRAWLADKLTHKI